MNDPAQKRAYLEVLVLPTGLALHANGAWTSAHGEAIERAVEEAASRIDSTSSITLDLGAMVELDTLGAWLLETIRRRAQARGVTVSITAVNDRFVTLVDRVKNLNLAPAPPARVRVSLADRLEQVGRSTVAAGREAVVFMHMLGALGTTLFRIARRPRSLRLTSLVYQLYRVSWQAIPIVALIAFLIGAIITQQGIFHFRKFGAESYVVDMVGILVLRELGVLIVAIMVAGRSGSAYTAELGSMKMREEIDALSTMGLDPVDVLVFPRCVALILALPILTFLGDIAALYGGGMVEWAYGGMSPEIFVARLHEAISVTHFKVGMIKAPFMALVIGIIASVEGLKVKGSAESLGRQTTTSVVKSIFLVIVLDGLFAIFFASIGM